MKPHPLSNISNNHPSRARHCDEWLDVLRPIIERRIVCEPRGLQSRIGPSELGSDCVHCVTAKLAGWERIITPAWLPFVGSSVHAQFEQLFRMVDSDRFLTEYKVTVGSLPCVNDVSEHYDVTGSIDLVDVVSHCTVDWKIVGSSTVKNVRANGVSLQYQTQASLYGMGLACQGQTVERSIIIYLPRNSMSLSDSFIADWPFSPLLGAWALHRASTITHLLHHITNNHGTKIRDMWINSLPRSHCFDCGSWKNDLLFDENPQLPDDVQGLVSHIPLPPCS